MQSTIQSFTRPGILGGGVKKLAYSSNSVLRGASSPSMHSEEGGLYKLRRLVRDRKFNPQKSVDIIVVKLTKTCQLSFSRPCRACIIRLEKSGFNIRRVYYSNEYGSISYEPFANLVKSKGNFSRGTRAKNNLP